MAKDAPRQDRTAEGAAEGAAGAAPGPGEDGPGTGGNRRGDRRGTQAAHRARADLQAGVDGWGTEAEPRADAGRGTGADRRATGGTPTGVAGDDAGGLESPDVDWDEMLIQLARQPLEEGWVTLEEASEAAGASRSTLRSWYRTGQIPSRMVAGVHGPQRLVPLDSVVSRALGSARARRQLEHARSLEAEVAELRRRVEALERLLGLH